MGGLGCPGKYLVQGHNLQTEHNKMYASRFMTQSIGSLSYVCGSFFFPFLFASLSLSGMAFSSLAHSISYGPHTGIFVLYLLSKEYLGQ